MTIYYSAKANTFFDDRVHNNLPDDAVEITEQVHSDLLAAQSAGKSISSNSNGNPIAIDRAVSVEQKKSVLITSVQRHLDGQARSMGYDDIATAVTYAEEPSAKTYQTEGRALRAWRSLVWMAALPRIDANPIQPVNEMINSLPKFGG